MCLVLVAIDLTGDCPLVVAANRDERHDRPADALHWWADQPGLAAGRDSRAGGTWFGATTSGRFAAVLNDPSVEVPPAPPTRGRLVPDFLAADGPEAWLHELAEQRARYAGFHLVAAANGRVWYCSSRIQHPHRLEAGLHGIDRHGLGGDAPRLHRARGGLEPLLQAGAAPEVLLAALGDTTEPGAPAAGAPAHARGDLEPVFVTDPLFGTRCSTVLRLTADGRAACHERRFDASGRVQGETALCWETQAAAAAAAEDTRRP